MARPIKRLQAEPEIAAELRRRLRASTCTVREKERAAMVLLRLDGLGVEAAAGQLGTTAKRVSIWTIRFKTHGLAGLEDRSGRGRKPSIPAAKVERVITEATRPPRTRNRWSVRSMGRHAGDALASPLFSWNRRRPAPASRTAPFSEFGRRMI